MIKTQMGTHNRSEMVAVLGIPCTIPPHYSNSNCKVLLVQIEIKGVKFGE
jgi:hypothetical protein